jgi:hypothetical protein
MLCESKSLGTESMLAQGRVESEVSTVKGVQVLPAMHAVAECKGRPGMCIADNHGNARSEAPAVQPTDGRRSVNCTCGAETACAWRAPQ